jgi:hypothetical protein
VPLATLIASTRNVLADDAAWASYDVDAATMRMEWNDMNAASTPYDPVLARADVAGGAGGADVCFGGTPRPARSDVGRAVAGSG